MCQRHARSDMVDVKEWGPWGRVWLWWSVSMQGLGFFAYEMAEIIVMVRVFV